MWLAGWFSTALGCAGLVHDDEALAESGASETVFERLDGSVEVTYEVVYEGDATDFGWVVPIPGEVLEVVDGDAERLARLRTTSAPEVFVEAPAEAKKGCFGGSAKGGDGRANDALAGGNGVDVLAEGFTGTYGYAVVAADDAAALAAWADAGGWSLAGVQADLQHYLDLGQPLVLFDLHPDAAETGPARALPPITVRYAGDALAFPAVMARSGGLEQRTTVYVLADSRADLVDGWSVVDLDEVNGAGEAADVLAERLRDLGADRTWARTWAGNAEGRFLTRFDLLAEAADHTDDAIFAPDGTTYGQALAIYVWEPGEAWLLLPLGALLLGARRRRLTAR